MTPTEIRDALNALKEEAGMRAWTDVTINPDRGDKFVSATLYPFGITKDEGYINVSATTFEEALRLLRETWDTRKEQHRAEIIKKMALAIIRNTAEYGECTDAALRNEFEPGAVNMCGEEACTLANTMAAKGPFSIKRKRGANAA